MKARTLICPECGGTDIIYEVGQTGQKYRCKGCNYLGAFVIERDLEEPEYNGY